MTDPVKTASITAGLVFGIGSLFAGLAILRSCHTETTEAVTTKPAVTAPADPTPLPFVVPTHEPLDSATVSQLDSLHWALTEKDSALAAALVELRWVREATIPFRYEVDSSRIVIGKLEVSYCPDNGEFSGSIVVDTLIVPESVRTITNTVFVQTGVDWYWIPAAVILGALIATGLYAWIMA